MMLTSSSSSLFEFSCTPYDVRTWIIAFGVVLLIAKLLHFGDDDRNNNNNNKSKKKKKYPPLAPCSLMETVKSMSGSDHPWFMIRIAKQLRSNIFRLRLPIFGTPMVVVVGDVDVVREILLDPLSKKPETLYKSFRHIVGERVTIFTENGSLWHGRRKSTAPAFSSMHIKRMNQVALEKTEIWIKETLHPMIEKDEAFDVAKEMIDIIFSAICETAFEYQLSDQEKSSFVSELELALKEFIFRTSLNPFRPLLGPFLPERRRAFHATQVLLGIAQNIIDAYRQRDEPLKDTLIDKIMKSTAYADDSERKADIIVFLVAGHDTTAYTLAWILLELARNPKEQELLRNSLSALPEKEWSKSNVLAKIVKEGMRLHPVGATGPSGSIGRDIETKNGILLPKGAYVFWPPILMMRDPTIFQDPDTFKPSRWDDASKEMNDAFFPFGLGKRSCVGQSLAMAELHCILARICAEFHLEVVDEGSPGYFLTLKPVGARLKAHNAGFSA